MALHKRPEYEQLPYLETLHEVAQFVIDMVSEKRGYYMNGLKSSLNEMHFSTAQIGLLDHYGSPKLSEKLEPHLCGENKHQIPQILERAFWDPLIDCAHKMVDPKPLGDVSAGQMKLLYSLVLYSTLHANINNINLMIQTNTPLMAEPVNSDCLVADFEHANPYQVSTNMSAEHFMRILRQGILPQLQRALEQETAWGRDEIASAKKNIQEVWELDPARYNKGLYLRPLDTIEWMKYSKPDPEFADYEAEIGYRESRKLLPPPPIPEN